MSEIELSVVEPKYVKIKVKQTDITSYCKLSDGYTQVWLRDVRDYKVAQKPEEIYKLIEGKEYGCTVNGA